MGIFQINTELNARISPKQATLDEVKAYLNDKERGTLESWAIARANTIVGSTDGAQFPSAAKKAGLVVKSAGPFIINIGNPTFYAYNQQIPLMQTPFANSDPELQAAEQDEAFMTELFSLPKGKSQAPRRRNSVMVFSVTGDKEATNDDTAMVKFAYPTSTSDHRYADSQYFLKSKKLKDEFNTTFFKIFKTNDQATAATTTTVAPAAK